MEPLLAFTTEQVHRLTGLSLRQLRYWDNSKFFSPSYGSERRRAYGRIYSFQDLVFLRTISLLRKKYHVQLPELRKVGDWLADHPHETWSTLTFFVAGRHVFFEDRVLQVWLAGSRPSQIAIPIEMQRVIRDAETDANVLRARTPAEIGQIARHRLVSHNAPVLAGTRVRTRAVWRFHQAGYSHAQIIEQYSRLEPSDVDAAIQFE